MKKRNILLVIVLLVMVVLTGCDAVLEMFYPEYAVVEGDFEIFIQTRFYIPDPGTYPAVKVLIQGSSTIPSGGETATSPHAGWTYDWWMDEFNVWFLAGDIYIGPAPAGANYIWVWLDENNDDVYDAIEYGGFAEFYGKADVDPVPVFDTGNAFGPWMDGIANIY